MSQYETTPPRLPSGLFYAALMALMACAARGAEPFLEKADLFKAGDYGYKLFHIPGIVVTAKGTVLAWCEARKNGGDWDDIRILWRRSTDDGKTWSAAQSIADVPGPKAKNPFALRVRGDTNDVTYNNPVLIADRRGAVHMLFCLEYMRCFYQRSDDDGLTWARPVEITPAFEAFRSHYDWKVLATGPNHGIQLRSGRFLVPAWLSTGTGGNAHRPSVTATIYSDDSGKTWQAGELAVPNTDEWVNPNEAIALELADGTIMLNVRNESKLNRRLVTTSKDGAKGWITPRFDDALLEPICMAGLVRYSFQSGGRNRILFSNPDNLSRADGKERPGGSRDRKNLSLKLSYDEGQIHRNRKAVGRRHVHENRHCSVGNQPCLADGRNCPIVGGFGAAEKTGGVMALQGANPQTMRAKLNIMLVNNAYEGASQTHTIIHSKRSLTDSLGVAVRTAPPRQGSAELKIPKRRGPAWNVCRFEVQVLESALGYATRCAQDQSQSAREPRWRVKLHRDRFDYAPLPTGLQA
jgi:sialidase-1